MLNINPSSSEVKEYADQANVDRYDAKKYLKKQKLRAAINDLGYCSVELKDVLNAMVTML